MKITAFQLNAAPSPQINAKQGLFPKLESATAGNIAWTWNAVNPDRWQIWQSVDGLNWASFGIVLGVARTASGLTSGTFYYVDGLDAGANRITANSNIVICL